MVTQQVLCPSDVHSCLPEPKPLPVLRSITLCGQAVTRSHYSPAQVCRKPSRAFHFQAL